MTALPLLGEPRGLDEFGVRQPRGDLLSLQLPLRALELSLVRSAATSDPPALIGGNDCLRGWLNGGSKNCEVGLKGRVGLSAARSLSNPTSVFPSEEILRLLAAGDSLSLSDKLREEVEVDNKTCGVLYLRGKRGLSLLVPSPNESGADNRVFILFSTSASSFWSFFFSRSISFPIESLWKFIESSCILSFLSAIEFMNIVLSAYSVLWYAMFLCCYFLTVKVLHPRYNFLFAKRYFFLGCLQGMMCRDDNYANGFTICRKIFFLKCAPAAK